MGPDNYFSQKKVTLSHMPVLNHKKEISSDIDCLLNTIIFLMLFQSGIHNLQMQPHGLLYFVKKKAREH
jgi:hypothetical protein